MDIAEDDVGRLVQEAVDEIERETATSVLIIEDEPLISMQLEDLVRSLGHDICGTAATRTQAQQVVAENRPGLVLADIQLADGSSGLDAVDDILAIDPVPVIFITAYPERLLTGDRPEPTYLITKPFQEDTVRAAISQALFFGSSRPLSLRLEGGRWPASSSSSSSTAATRSPWARARPTCSRRSRARARSRPPGARWA